MTTSGVVKTVAVVKTAPYKNLVIMALSLAIMCVLLGQNLAKAQGFVPGTPTPSAPTPGGGGTNDPLAGAGGVIDGLFNLTNNFTFDGLIGFGCTAATAADEYAQSTESPDSGTYSDVADTVCSLGEYYTEIKGLSQNYEEIFKGWGKNLFTDFMQYDLGLGTSFSRAELEGFSERIKAVVEGDEDPDKLFGVFQQIAQEKATKNQETYTNAPEGTSAAAYEKAMANSPSLRTQQGLIEMEKYQNTMTQGQSMANLLQSGKIADTQMESDVMESLNKDINEQVAPGLREDAATAVSTRATVQEVVNTLTLYMQQDVDTMTHISKQLALQSQQEVYTAQQLGIVADSLLKEERSKLEAKQAALRNGFSKYEKEFGQATDGLVSVGGSIANLGNADETNSLDFTIFNQ
jgi:hypothetical protein